MAGSAVLYYLFKCIYKYKQDENSDELLTFLKNINTNPLTTIYNQVYSKELNDLNMHLTQAMDKYIKVIGDRAKKLKVVPVECKKLLEQLNITEEQLNGISAEDKDVMETVINRVSLENLMATHQSLDKKEHATAVSKCNDTEFTEHLKELVKELINLVEVAKELKEKARQLHDKIDSEIKAGRECTIDFFNALNKAVNSTSNIMVKIHENLPEGAIDPNSLLHSITKSLIPADAPGGGGRTRKKRRKTRKPRKRSNRKRSPRKRTRKPRKRSKKTRKYKRK